MPPYPYFRALYAVPVRQVRGLLTASFRFRLTADTLAVRLCASLLPTRTWDFHPLENAHAGQTKSPAKESSILRRGILALSNISFIQNQSYISRLTLCRQPYPVNQPLPPGILWTPAYPCTPRPGAYSILYASAPPEPSPPGLPHSSGWGLADCGGTCRGKQRPAPRP